MAPVRVGLVGVGQRGLQHLGALWQIPQARVVALVDPYPDNLEEAKIQRYVKGFSLAGIRTYPSYGDLLQAGGVDALYFSIPPGRHAGEVVESARAGLHLFVEKPVTLYLDEALEMDRAIQSAGVIASVGFQLRYEASSTVVRRFLAEHPPLLVTWVGNGALEWHSVKHTHTEAAGGPANRIWAANQAWSGSTVVEAGIHQLDLMRYWAGDVDWVEARYAHRDPADIVDGGDNPYGYSVTFGFASGMIANLILTRLRRTFYADGYQDIVWSHGHLKLEAEGPVAYYYEGPYPPPGPVDPASLRHVLPMPPRRDATLEINRAFVRAVALRDPSGLRSTFTDSLNSHAAVLGANVSDRLGGQRVVLGELLAEGRYAAYRRKPVA
ncbi:MAG: Gfo/Idh/MocA family oxidoreductase [Candidatus Latescibacterota bacterium]